MALETFLSLVLAVGLIAASSMHLVQTGVMTGRAVLGARNRRMVDLKGLRQAAEIARLNSELQSTVNSSTIPWRVMEVARIIDESADCRSYYLIDPYRQPLPAFMPGQHVMVRPALAGEFQTTRCYSLSAAPDRRFWRITVKRQPGQPAVARRRNGGLSGWLHETIHPGDCLLIGGPNGKFVLTDDPERPVVLTAAGVGITPIVSMLSWSVQHAPQRRVAAFIQASDPGHWPLGKEIHDLGGQHPRCNVVTYFSRSTAAECESLNNNLAGSFRLGKFTATDLMQAFREGCDYILCGPNEWMESLRVELTAAGVDSSHIHWESFGSATETHAPHATCGPAVDVHFELSQVQAPWHDTEQSLWELAREHHLELPSGCLSGVCGCCKVKILSGQVTYDREVTIELEADECLTCIARPASPLRLQA